MAFKMNGQVFSSMLAIAKELGKSRVYRKDFEKLGIVEVADNELEVAKAVLDTPVKETQNEVEVEEVTEVTEVETEDAGLDKDDPEVGPEETEETDGGESEVEEVETDEEEVSTKDEDKPKENAENEDKPKEEKAKKSKLTEEQKKQNRAERREKRKEEKRKEREEANKPTPEMLEKAKELQTKSGYSNIWDWAVDMKKKSADEVYALATELGLTWETHKVERINRMRAVVVLRENLFPGEKRPKVRQSAWSGVSNEEVAKLCKENNIEYTESTDTKITRMRMVKALKDAGIKSPS